MTYLCPVQSSTATRRGGGTIARSWQSRDPKLVLYCLHSPRSPFTNLHCSMPWPLSRFRDASLLPGDLLELGAHNGQGKISPELRSTHWRLKEDEIVFPHGRSNTELSSVTVSPICRTSFGLYGRFKPWLKKKKAQNLALFYKPSVSSRVLGNPRNQILNSWLGRPHPERAVVTNTEWLCHPLIESSVRLVWNFACQGTQPCGAEGLVTWSNWDLRFQIAFLK